MKCTQYWPDGPEPLTFSTIQISLYDTTMRDSGYVVEKSFKLKSGGSERVVTHFQFTNWPDHGTPEPGPFVRLVELADQRNTTKGPLVVHCSAGIGRTGTFIAVHSLLASIKYDKSISQEEPRVRIPQTVMNMRQQRPGMVQTEVCEKKLQYILL